MMRTAALLALWFLLAVGMLTGCGGGDSSPPVDKGGQTPATEGPYAKGTTTTTPPPVGPEIVVTDYAFAVPPSVKPGEQIIIRNNADGAHSVTSDAANLFDVRISGGGGISRLTAPTTPGTYPFHCKYHLKDYADMRGTLTVQ
jgi:plastocyanin